MGLSCGSKFAKFFLFIFNVIFWLVGAVLLGVGIWALVDDEVLQLLHVASVDTSDSLVNAASITLVIIGTIVFITGFFGCCGAIRESPCMLLTYASIVGLVLILQIVAGILGVVFQDTIEKTLEQTMNITVQEYYGQPNYATTEDAWDFMQVEFSCCGAIDGPSDWQSSYWKTQQNESVNVPPTCCVLNNNDYNNPHPKNVTMCNQAAVGEVENKHLYIHTQPCYSELLEWVKDHAAILIGIAFGLAFVQIIGIVAACCLGRTIKSQYDYV